MVVDMLRRGWEAFAQSRGLKKHEMSGRTSWYMPEGLLPGDWAHFVTGTGKRAKRKLVGIRGKRKIRYHFAVSARPQVRPFPRLVIYAHVVFSEGGVLITSKNAAQRNRKALPLRPIVTRINRHRGVCPCCQKRVAAPAPEGFDAGSPFGPGLSALIIHLHVTQAISFQRLVSLIAEVFGVTISEGAIANILARAQAPLVGAAQPLAQAVRTSPVVGSDETSARVGGKTWWQWVRLIDLCGLSNTLIGDADGIYHPALFNDRLLLGLKGTMSEAELYVLRARLNGGIRNKAARGELRRGLPVGLVWGDADGEVRLHPDEAVRTAIASIFARFAETGSARRVWLWFRSEGLRLPAQMVPKAEILWVDASYHAIHQVLSNPVYAGAYTYGRTRQETTLDGSGAAKKRMRQLPRSEWQVLIKEHHEGYIDWRTYEANQARLAANTRPGPHDAGLSAG
jgi:transposase